MRLVVIDTNVWISAFLNRKGFPAQIKDAWINGEFEVVLSSPLLQELSEVLHRPRIKNKYSILEDEITQFIELLLRRAVLVGISGQLRLCRDERDDMFLETAITAGAGYLISRDDDLKGDSDLSRLMRERGVEVMTVLRFLSELKNEEA